MSKRQNKKIMVAGHICLDITPVFSSSKVESIGDILSPGKLVNVGEADIHTGGAVANTGLGMKVLGANVSLAGKVGKDQFGQIVKGILDEYGCGDGLVVDEDSSTSYSVVLAAPGLDRIFLHNPGANDTFCAADITPEMLSNISHFHLGYPPLMHKLYENNGEELFKLFTKVKSNGVTTSLDMAAIDPNSQAANQDWSVILQRVMPYVDFFLPSIEELGFMLDRSLYEQWNKRASGKDITLVLDWQKDVRPLAEALLDMGGKVLLIKCGAPGMYYRTSNSQAIVSLCNTHMLNPETWSGQEGFEVSYRQDTIVSGTGAGDTSIAAFLTSMLEGHDLKNCVQLAAAAGACCISAHDALSGLQPLDTLQEKIDAGWQKRKVVL